MIRHTIIVRYLDARRKAQEVRFADWSEGEARTRAWKFTAPKRRCGGILTFVFLHRAEFIG